MSSSSVPVYGRVTRPRLSRPLPHRTAGGPINAPVFRRPGKAPAALRRRTADDRTADDRTATLRTRTWHPVGSAAAYTADTPKLDPLLPPRSRPREGRRPTRAMRGHSTARGLNARDLTVRRFRAACCFAWVFSHLALGGRRGRGGVRGALRAVGTQLGEPAGHPGVVRRERPQDPQDPQDPPDRAEGARFGPGVGSAAPSHADRNAVRDCWTR
ncbi:hypothetical protein GCM10009639_09080 [Kitasatospora putterlickiae]|uniref:Uncharacterized protein n=1 Tax=Kitasatospora putterlickiae TaxID=221725 RepID=A0ABN1XQW9_9ACTN